MKVITWKQLDLKKPNYTREKWKKWELITGEKFLTVLNDIREWEHVHHDADSKPSTELKRATNPLFDPNAELCSPLQRRFDGFKQRWPTQFSTYGPLNSWLSRRFPLHIFLVKPQRRFVVRTDWIGIYSSYSVDSGTPEMNGAAVRYREAHNDDEQDPLEGKAGDDDHEGSTSGSEESGEWCVFSSPASIQSNSRA